MVRALSGPRLPPARGRATHLVVLCHGYGADGNDLIGLAPHWQRLLPTVAFAAPNAPEPCAAVTRLSMVSDFAARPCRNAARRRSRGRARSKRFWRANSRGSNCLPDTARTGGLQPGHDDVAACRTARASPRRSSAIPACLPEADIWRSFRTRHARPSCLFTATRTR